jgi:hypothetical protein
MPDEDDRGDFGVLIHTIEKARKTQLRIYHSEYQGNEYINIREFFDSEDGWRPTKKGVTLPVRLYGSLLKGVLELGGELGLIEQSFLAELDALAET